MKPMPKARLDGHDDARRLRPPYKTYHGVAKSGVREIVWTGGTLPDDFYDEFVFSAQISDAFAPGDGLFSGGAGMREGREQLGRGSRGGRGCASSNHLRRR